VCLGGEKWRIVRKKIGRPKGGNEAKSNSKKPQRGEGGIVDGRGWNLWKPSPYEIPGGGNLQEKVTRHPTMEKQ